MYFDLVACACLPLATTKLVVGRKKRKLVGRNLRRVAQLALNSSVWSKRQLTYRHSGNFKQK